MESESRMGTKIKINISVNISVNIYSNSVIIQTPLWKRFPYQNTARFRVLNLEWKRFRAYHIFKIY